LIAQDVTAGGRVLLEAAEVLWSGLSRVCDQVGGVFGFCVNTSVACIPADIALFAAELVVGAAETVVEHIAFCDSAVDSSEIEGVYERAGHIHTDLVDHDTNIDADLAAHDANIDGDLIAHDANIDADLIAHDANIDADLVQHDTDIKALLADLQGAVDENQRLIKISMSRQLEVMRLLITPSGRRVINMDVLTCTGDDCPIYPALQLCENGSLSWNCDD
jgi:hypothetical protein